MNKKKVQASFMNVGASSLLVIFLILCIAVFAALSLSSAKSDYSFSEKMAEHKTAYYDASNTAEQILAEVDVILEAAASGTSDPQRFYEDVKAGLDSEVMGVPMVFANDGQTMSWQVPIDKTQVLSVELKLHLSGDGFYTITRWQTVTLGN